MNRRTWYAVAVVALLVISVAASRLVERPHGVFSSLRVGQPVSVRDRDGWVEIGTTDDDLPAGHTVVEIGPDYLVVRDVAGVVETRIPVSAVRAVVHWRADQKP